MIDEASTPKLDPANAVLAGFQPRSGQRLSRKSSCKNQGAGAPNCKKDLE
jgi:hypothetical protein